MVRIKDLDRLRSPINFPAGFVVSLDVASPLVVISHPAVVWEAGIHLSRPLHLVAWTSVTGEHIFKVLVSDGRAKIADGGVAGVWRE